MPSRGWWGFSMAVVLGSVGPAGGCGGDESGTQVKVDKEKEEAVLKAMGAYMEKQSKPKANTAGRAKPGQ